jgi:hypothetical protein
MFRACSQRCGTFWVVLFSPARFRHYLKSLHLVWRQIKAILHTHLTSYRHPFKSPFSGWSRIGWTRSCVVWGLAGLCKGCLFFSVSAHIHECFVSIHQAVKATSRVPSGEIFPWLHALACTMFSYDNSKEYKSFLGRSLVVAGKVGRICSVG